MSKNPWTDLKDDLRKRLDTEDFQVWIEPLKLLSQENTRLVVGCPNAFHRRWLQDHYLPVMRQAAAAREITAQICLEVAPCAALETKPCAPRQMELPQMVWALPLLNQRFVFDNFVSGVENEFALAAAKALANGQRLFSNTLFLVSDTGLGKSHLTQAVGHHVLHNAGQTKVAYLTAEDFANQMISSLRKKKIEDFKDRYRRDCSLLLLEEVQFLTGKEKTQDELAYTLDALADAGKRVIFTSSQPPQELKGLKPGLKSRLSAGMTVPIGPPDQATRVRILKRQAEAEGVDIASEVLEYLAQEITGDVRPLLSALVGIMAKGSLTKRPMDLALAAEIMGQMNQQRKKITLGQIRDLVAKTYGLDVAALVGKSRRKDITRPRNLAMFLCRRHTDSSYAVIGRLFNRDHATAMYGVDQIDRGLNLDPKLPQEIAYLEQRLLAG